MESLRQCLLSQEILTLLHVLRVSLQVVVDLHVVCGTKNVCFVGGDCSSVTNFSWTSELIFLQIHLL